LKELNIKGWIRDVRSLGGIIFLEVIEGNSLTPITVVIKKSENPLLIKTAKKIKLGSAIQVKGIEPERIISKKGKEIHAKELSILAEPSEPSPLDPTGKTKALLDTVLQYRYLALRFPEQRAIFRIRAGIVEASRRYLSGKGLLEVHTPKICGAGAEGGATVFKLDYFGKKAFLSQSPQLYKQMLMCGLPGVYEITPYFRAEKFDTPRHLNESWGIDAEISFITDFGDVMSLLEGLIVYIFEYIKDNYKKEIELLDVDLEIPRRPFKRITYSDALEILRNNGLRLEWGSDLDSEAEKVLGKTMMEEGYDAYFIIEYPWEAKPFYIMKKGAISLSFDLDYRGIELASGGQREHRYWELIENMKNKGLDPKSFSFYLEAFKYGMPPHGGFGLGLDRLLMVLIGARNIREVVLFPRDRQRLIP